MLVLIFFWFICFYSWAVLEAAMNAVGKTDFNINRDKLLPIPASEQRLSSGLLTQNPGFE